MKHIVVQYTVRSDQADENTRLIAAVFDSLAAAAPAGISYASYRLEDGVSFMHVASVADPANNPLQQLAAFKTFSAGVKDRCDVPPRTTVLQQIGRYSAP